MKDFNMLEQMMVFILLFMMFIGGILFEKYILNSRNIQYSDKPKSFFDKNQTQGNTPMKIDIDDKKIVLGVSTDSMSKSSKELGNTTSKKDNTQSAISKLKNMKGK